MVACKFLEQALGLQGIVSSKDLFVDLIKEISGNFWVVSVVRNHRQFSQLFTFRTQIIWNTPKVLNALLPAARSFSRSDTVWDVPNERNSQFLSLLGNLQIRIAGQSVVDLEEVGGISSKFRDTLTGLRGILDGDREGPKRTFPLED